MIESLKISNFKSHLDSSIPFGKLTVLTGVNGSGKTAVLQALLLLRQSYVNNRLAGGLDLNKPLCSIGTGQDALCRFAADGEIRFCIVTATGEELVFAFDAEHGLDDSFLRYARRQPAHPSMADLLAHPLFNNDFQYVGASRWGGRSLFPKDTYAVEQQRQISLAEGQGELVAHFLNKYGRDDVFDYCDGASADLSLLAQTVCWEQRVSPGVTLSAQPAGNNTDSFLMLYGFKAMSPEAKSLEGLRAENIGFGISYALPVVVALLAAPRGGLVIIENPEAHLHPAGQAAMAQLITKVAANGVQVVVETHSDHIITGLQLAAKDNEDDPSKGMPADDIVINYLTTDERLCARVANVRIGERGVLDESPEGFFDQAETDFRKLFCM